MKFLPLLFLVSLFQAVGFAAKTPNVIVILVDDLGQTDLGCYGSKYYETPNIDRLAKDGLRFTQAYSACTVCSPTRASLLTGKYPARLHLTDWIPGQKNLQEKLLPPPGWAQQLPLKETTLGELFKSKGYATASIGKWHLGNEAFYPEKQGFDVNIGGYHRGQPPSYFSPYKIPTLTDGPEGEFLTDREAAEASKFIRANQAKPFFIYLPMYAVHTPLMGKKAVVEKYTNKADEATRQGKPAYAALVESVDDAIGEIRKTLEETKLWDSTIIIFTADNGGLVLSNVTTNLNLRAGKGSAYEGGVRIPLIVRVPGVTKADTTCAAPVITPDIFPTLAKQCFSAESKLDGADLSPLLAGAKSIEREAIYWHYPHYHAGGATPYSTIRMGDEKLIHFYEDGRDELYNLASDPLEKNNLAATQPEVTKKLRANLDAWISSTAAQLPVANPAYTGEPRKPKAKKQL